jgi:DNA processing protein
MRALISHFHSPRAVLEAKPRELVKVKGIDKKTALSIAHYEDGSRYADQQLARLKRTEGRIVTLWDKEYPESLRRIYDPPPLLYLLGSFEDADKYSIAIVGTRSPTNYGKSLAERFAHDIGALGLTIVSGLARGIDTIAHTAAVRAGARTLAVIDSGIDTIYPPENKKLAEHVAQNGAVVSEFEMGAKPDAEHFPQRNRVISGLSLGTLVIETDVGGGVMLTARWALDQNREVFAIPGPITESRSAGCNLLIKQGEAKLVQISDDILVELEPKLRPLLRGSGKLDRKPPVELPLFEKSLYDHLSDEPLHIDAIAVRVGLSTSDALVHLLGLEFKGLVRQYPGKTFVRTG